MSSIDTGLLQGLGINQPVGSKKKDELGQDAFLKLMTTQLQNQDPFKPMESGEFLSQIAQFGTVTGIQDMQKSITDLAGSLTSNQGMEAVALVGRDVLVPSNMQVLQPGQPFVGAAELPAAASDVRIKIYDSSSQLVRSFSAGPQLQGVMSYNWDGLDDAGQALPGGRYFIEVDAVMQGQSVALEHLAQSKVQSVTFGNADQGLVLALDGQGDKRFSDIRQVR